MSTSQTFSKSKRLPASDGLCTAFSCCATRLDLAGKTLCFAHRPTRLLLKFCWFTLDCLFAAIMGSYLLLLLPLALQVKWSDAKDWEGTSSNILSVTGAVEFMGSAVLFLMNATNATCNSSVWRKCAVHEHELWAHGGQMINQCVDEVRWWTADMGERTECVCVCVCVDCPSLHGVKCCWCSRRSHTQSHTAGVGCCNVTQGEAPHLTLCWLKHCREGAHIYIYTHTRTLSTHVQHTPRARTESSLHSVQPICYLSLWEQYVFFFVS